MSDTEQLQAEFARLLDPEARYERGEDSTRAQLAGFAEAYVPALLEKVARLEQLVYPKALAK